MWKRKELKSKSRKNLKANYARAISICFIIAVLTTAYGSSTALIEKYDSDKSETNNVVQDVNNENTASIVDDMIQTFKKDNPKAGEFQLLAMEEIYLFIDNVVPSKSVTANLLRIFNGFVGGTYNIAILFIIIGLFIKLFYRIFISTALQQGEKRFYLENRYYKKTQISKVFFLFRLGYVKHSAAVILKKWIFTVLWSLTIVGGFIKNYEYKMIPYILAENPQTTSKEAFALSKEMMKGHKWKTFLLDLSFVGWLILGNITLGLVEIFYVNPYKAGTFAELYMLLRKESITAGSEYKYCFSDVYLEPEPEFVMANEGAYPYSKYVTRRKERTPINPGRKYTVTSYILLFFIFSIIGWCYEVGIHLVTDGIFVNRGTMFGPWLPIYGSGGVMVLILMRRWIDKPILTFFATMGICSVVEYLTSWYLEVTKGVRWWDYSGYFMNINGRICLLGATVFGIGGCAFLYYIAPRLDDMLLKIPRAPKIAACIILGSFFSADFAYSTVHPNTGEGITDYGVIDFESQRQAIAVKVSQIKRL